MILRDPVHGLVSFEAEEERIIERLMDTPEVQRLRRVRQLGVTSFAFPGAEHTRFAHAVGAAFVMKLLLARLRAIHGALPYWQQITSDRARDAIAAAMLHDVGHGPLSHLFEDAIPGVAEHEEWTRRIVLDPATEVHRVLAAEDPAMPGRVAALVSGKHPLPYLARSVSGTFDVDRCDYLLRDAHATGVRYGVFDLDWLLRSLRFAPSASKDDAPALAIDGAKGLPAIEAFLARAPLHVPAGLLPQGDARGRVDDPRDPLARRAAHRRRRAPRGDARARSSSPRTAHDDPARRVPRARRRGRSPSRCTPGSRARTRPSPISRAASACARSSRRTSSSASTRTPTARARALAIARDVRSQRRPRPRRARRTRRRDRRAVRGRGGAARRLLEGHAARRSSEVSFLLSRLKGETLARVRLVFAPELREAITAAVSGSEDAPSD